MLLFFLLGLIAGGLLCRRGPKGETVRTRRRPPKTTHRDQ